MVVSVGPSRGSSAGDTDEAAQRRLQLYSYYQAVLLPYGRAGFFHRSAMSASVCHVSHRRRRVLVDERSQVLDTIVLLRG